MRVVMTTDHPRRAITETEPRGQHRSGEARLWATVIMQAVCEGASHGNQKGLRLRRAHALRWIFSASHEPGSYLWACAALGISSEAIRHIFRAEGHVTLERIRRTGPKKFSA